MITAGYKSVAKVRYAQLEHQSHIWDMCSRQRPAGWEWARRCGLALSAGTACALVVPLPRCAREVADVNERRDETLTVTLRAPSSLIRQVDTIARRDGVSRADVLRMALRSGLIAGPRRGFFRVSDGDVAGAAS